MCPNSLEYGLFLSGTILETSTWMMAPGESSALKPQFPVVKVSVLIDLLQLQKLFKLGVMAILIVDIRMHI